MKSKDIVKAIGEIDEKYLRSAEKSYNAYKAREVGGKILNGLKTVACAFIVIGVIVALWLPSVLLPRDPDPAAAPGSSETAPYKDAGTEQTSTDTAGTEITDPGTETDPQPGIIHFFTEGLTWTKDEVDVFYEAAATSGLLSDENSFYTKEKCYKVTPEGFEEKVGVKLFTIEDRTYIFDGKNACEIGGGSSGRLLSAVPCDLDLNGITDFVYTYYGGSGVLRMYFEYYDMTAKKAEKLKLKLKRVFYGSDTSDEFIFAARTADPNRIAFYGYFDDEKKDLGYLLTTENGYVIEPAESGAELIVIPDTSEPGTETDPVGIEYDNPDYVRYIERGNLKYSKADVDEFLSALDRAGIKLDNVSDHEIAQVTPDGFYRSTKARLFIAGDRSFVYKKGEVRELGGGIHGTLLSAYECDVDMDNDDIYDIVYTYNGGSGKLRTYVEVFNMRTGEITRAATLYNCDAFLTYGYEAEEYHVYAAPHAAPNDQEFPTAKYYVGWVYLWGQVTTDIKADYSFDLEYEEEKYKQEHPDIDPADHDLVSLTELGENVEVNIREVCRIPVGEGDGYVKCYKLPGDDFGPSNFGIDESGRVYIVDSVQQKLEFYTLEGGYIGKVDLNIEGRKRITYAVCSKGYIYAIYDQEAFYRIGENGEKVLITEGGFLASLAVSERDGRVVLFSFGSTDYVDDNCKLHTETEFGNSSAVFDKDGKTTRSIRFSRDGVSGEFAVSVNFDSTYTAGMLNGDLLLYTYNSDSTVFTLYAPDGTVRCSLLRKALDGDYCECRTYNVINGKLYIMLCRADYTVINEITVNVK